MSRLLDWIKMRPVLSVFVVYFVAAFVFDLWPFSSRTGWEAIKGERAASPTDLLPLSSYEKVSVNALFYDPSGREVTLGRFQGASACQAAAISHARSNNLINKDWGYVCCTIEHGSQCYRKIK